MINKIFKTILVLTVCLGISIPTNAAVSVSDGSAFVTKAEFSADLNNLSNRMAQLENSLDAKIDSLVSSYLTRNGIWNGAKQDLKFSTFQILHNPWNFILNNNNQGTSPIWYYSLYASKKVYPADGYTEIIEAVNKTGMIVFVQRTSRTFRQQWGSDNKSSGYKGHSTYIPIFTLFNITQNYEIGNVQFGQVAETVSPDSWTVGRLGVVCIGGTFTIIGFVNKGDKLGWDHRVVGQWQAGPWGNVAQDYEFYSGTIEANIY